MVGTVSVPDDGLALTLGLVGFSATKLWNRSLWYSKECWDKTGMIPSYAEMDKYLKSVSNRWYRSLHAQSSQAVLEELWQSYKSWFALRKKGDMKARPPGFRRKDTLSTITFKKDSFRWDGETQTLRVGVPESVFGYKYLYLSLTLPPGTTIFPEEIQVARLTYVKGIWKIHLTCDVRTPEPIANGHTMSIDLGQAVLAATACTDGKTAIWSGGELSGLERYFEKEKAKCTDSKSKKCRRTNSKRSRQRNHYLHTITKSIITDAEARKISTILVGDLTDIRICKNGDAKNWGDAGSQALHKWPFKKITNLLSYKAKMKGITVIQVSERYTSQDCSCCGTRRKASRVTRGEYRCPKCGSVIHADINGAVNMLKRYLPEETFSWSSGCLAQPVVNRFAWRDTPPLVHKPGTWNESGSASTNNPKALL